MNSQTELSNVLFWVQRAGVCIYLNDYESALNRIERALDAFNWLQISLVYGK